MRCGKTLLLEIIGQVAAEATPRLSNASEAVIFRLADTGATMLLDELESLRNQDREKFGNVMGLLNAGFQAGAKVPQAQKSEDGFEVVYFNAFCPKALAGINKLSDTLSDRSLSINMQRKTAAEKVERFIIRRQRQELENLRAEIGLWASERERPIAELYENVDRILVSDERLKKLDDRFLDITEPLLTIALFSDCEFSNGGGIVSDTLCGLLLDMSQAKGEIADDSSLAAILKILIDVVGKETKKFIASSELLEKVQPELPWCDEPMRVLFLPGFADYKIVLLMKADHAGTCYWFSYSRPALKTVEMLMGEQSG